MITIEAVKSHNPIRAAFETAGIRLVKDKAPCPFHPDKHPSLTLRGERWRCWGCGEGGDVIDFTAKFYGLNTKGAIRFLADRAGIKTANTQAEKAAAEKARKERESKAEAVRAFRKWEQKEVAEIAAILRRYNRLVTSRKTFSESELVDLAGLRGNIDILEYYYGILCCSNDEPKFRLYTEAKLDAGL